MNIPHALDIAASLRTALEFGCTDDAKRLASSLQVFLLSGGHIDEKPTARPHQIINIVALHYNVDGSQIRGPSRNFKFIRARRACTLLCREFTLASLPDIASEMCKTHSTIFGHLKFEKEKRAPEYQKAWAEIDTRFSRTPA